MLFRLFQSMLAGSILASPLVAADVGIAQTDRPGAIEARSKTEGYSILDGVPRLEPGLETVSPALAAAISKWLSDEFDLPQAQSPPAFAMVPQGSLALLRMRAIDSHGSNVGRAGSTIVAVYDDEARTIYLPKGWTGATAAELSIVVHEMVHHLQKEKELKYACPEEREQLAFAAQERWLAMYGTNLETEFELDPFTLLVRTNCPY